MWKLVYSIDLFAFDLIRLAIDKRDNEKKLVVHKLIGHLALLNNLIICFGTMVLNTNREIDHKTENVTVSLK